jgi:NADH:ubiquinone oxidoreductase subunit F (NADH-binding)
MTATHRLLAGLDPAAGPTPLAEHVARHGALPTYGQSRGPDRGLLDLVEEAGLLGHGGAGFPTGRKMRTVADGRGRAVVVANGMEGEPTASKDALLLGLAPHLVLDGVELAAAAVGADRAHVTVHRGSPGVGPLKAALAERPARRRLVVSVHELPSNYVASEESALVHWLQGGQAKPLHVPPRPFERGVDGRPTLINNVETLAHLALIARHGADWFRSVGTESEPGTLLVSVSGAVRHPGVTEVPFGTTVGDLLTSAGGPTEPISGLVVGGYFGTWVDPLVAATLPLTHAALRAEGGGLGAGIVVALPASACAVAETAHVLSYLANQSAGQCGPCVKGLPAIAGALVDLAHGRWSGRRDDELTRWLPLVAGRGACRHPDGAVRFAASLLRVFPDDVAAHKGGAPCRAAAHRPVLPVGPAPSRTWR